MPKNNWSNSKLGSYIHAHAQAMAQKIKETGKNAASQVSSNAAQVSANTLKGNGVTYTSPKAYNHSGNSVTKYFTNKE